MKEKAHGKFVSTADAGRLMNLVPASIRYLVRVGQLKVAIETGGGRLYLRKDVERLMAERATAARETAARAQRLSVKSMEGV